MKAEIVALRVISLSELHHMDNSFTEKSISEYNTEKLKQLLHGLGIDTNQTYEHQILPHRNSLNKIYTGSRWVGCERTDEEWLNSGYASQEAKDKAKGSRLLVDLYRNKGLSTDRLAGVWADEDVQKEIQ
jgi:hypothetical protein